MKTNIKSNKRLIIILVSVVIGMFGFGYALVPFYNVLCSALNINGKPNATPAAAASAIDRSRIVTIQFLSNNNANLPWEFRPLTKSIELHPGENRYIEYWAKNDTNRTMTIQAIPSISPTPAAKHLKKTECFCFDRQTLKAHQSMNMPILFHIDRDLPKDINTVTLSYTLFDVTGKPESQLKRVIGKPGT